MYSMIEWFDSLIHSDIFGVVCININCSWLFDFRNIIRTAPRLKMYKSLCMIIYILDMTPCAQVPWTPSVICVHG